MISEAGATETIFAAALRLVHSHEVCQSAIDLLCKRWLAPNWPARLTLQLDRLPPQISQSIQLRALLLQRLCGKFLSIRCQPFQHSVLCALLRPLRLQHDSMFGGPTRL
jgi:hypothetical protein